MKKVFIIVGTALGILIVSLGLVALAYVIADAVGYTVDGMVYSVWATNFIKSHAVVYSCEAIMAIGFSIFASAQIYKDNEQKEK